MFGALSENVEGFEKLDSQGSSLDKPCVTRWTNCFQNIIESYSSFQSLWEVCLKIIGCQSQIKTFSFFFGLCLGQRLFSLNDNLSRTLQKESNTAVNGHRLAVLTKETLESMRTGENFKWFYDIVLKKASNQSQVDHPSLPRKRTRPNYSILIYAAHHPTTVEEHYHLL